jgi:L-2,4-diaminobutyrate decarboxylase
VTTEALTSTQTPMSTETLAGTEALATAETLTSVEMQSSAEAPLRAEVPAARPLPAGGPHQVSARVRERLGEVLPEHGAASALANMDQLLRAESVHSRHPHTAAHLHCPTLPVAVAADALIAELNPSMDSWDQSAAACVIEDELIDAIGRLVYPKASWVAGGKPGGTVTSGGTEGNLLALLFARDEAVRRHFDVDPAQEGVPGYAAGKLIVLCSAVAHFSVARAAALLGLGEQAVRPVPVRADHSLDPAALGRLARELHSEGRRVAAIVATAGTTDAGAIDPLGPCAEVARQCGAWFHVDAAYGGPLLFSARHAARLAGIEQADSVSMDLHKFGWQPIPAGLVVTKSRDAFALAGRRVAYLSDLDDEQAGYPNLLGRSLRTTRRADAVKMVATLQTLGRAGLAERIERCFELTAYAAEALAAHGRFELALPPALTTVLFRYLPASGNPDQINAALRRRLLVDGSAVIGRTRLPEGHGLPARAGLPAGTGLSGEAGSLRLKLTLLNPDTEPADLDRLIELIAAAGDEEERCLKDRRSEHSRPASTNLTSAHRRDRQGTP